MSEICSKITAEGNRLVANAENLDFLLSNYTALVSNISNINNSLSSLQSTFSTYENLSMKQPEAPFLPYISSFQSVSILSYIVSGVIIALGMVCITLSCLVIVNRHSRVSIIINNILYGFGVITVFVGAAVCLFYLVQAIALKSMTMLFDQLPNPSIY